MAWLRPRFDEDVRDEPGRGRVVRLRLTRRTRTQLLAAFPMVMVVLALAATALPLVALRSGDDVPEEAFVPALVAACLAVLLALYGYQSVHDYVEVDRFGLRHHHRSRTEDLPWSAIEAFVIVGSSSSESTVIYPAVVLTSGGAPVKLIALGAHSRARAQAIVARLISLQEQVDLNAIDGRVESMFGDDSADDSADDSSEDAVDELGLRFWESDHWTDVHGQPEPPRGRDQPG